MRALRILQVYSIPGRRLEFEARIARAREWLLAVKPRTTDEHAMLLLGLSWTGADHTKIPNIADSLIAHQRETAGGGQYQILRAMHLRRARRYTRFARVAL